MGLEMVRRGRHVLALLAFLLSGETARAQSYSLTELGELPAGTLFSWASAINNLGTVVGGVVGAGDAFYKGCAGGVGTKPFVWTAAGGMRVLGPSPFIDINGLPSQACAGKALAVNDQGTVVGVLDYDGPIGTRAFIWTAERGVQRIHGGPGAATHVNRAGEVVGRAGESGFRWTARNGLEMLRIPGHAAEAVAINSAGQVAGVIRGCGPGGFLIWTASGQVQRLRLDGLLATLPRDTDVCSGGAGPSINDGGVVVGSISVALASGESGSITFKGNAETRVAESLEALTGPGIQFTEAYAIDNRETIVGSSNGRAVIWQPGIGVRDLNALLDRPGTGWTLRSAHAINEAGQIVASGVRHGETRAVLLTPAAVEKPVLSVLPASLDFGAVAVGTTKTLSVTVRNTGTGVLSGTASVAVPFSILTGSPFSLDAGQAREVIVQFTPTPATRAGRTVIVSSNGGDVLLPIKGRAR